MSSLGRHGERESAAASPMTAGVGGKSLPHAGKVGSTAVALHRRVMVPSGDETALLEYRSIGEDHNRRVFGVWPRDLRYFSAALPRARLEHLCEVQLIVARQFK